MTTLSKIDIAALKKADVLCVHLDSRNSDGLVRAIKRKEKTERDPYAQDVEHVIPAGVTLHGSHAMDAHKRGAVKCFGYVNFYHSQHTHASCVINTLRAGDEITFRFWPDAWTNTNVANAGLHGDVLYMDVRRPSKNGKVQRFEWKLDMCICPDNTARMVQGVPMRDSCY